MPPPTPPIVLAKHKGPVHIAVYNTGSSYLLTGGQDRQIKLWNPTSGVEVKSYSGHGYEVLGLDCTRDNTKFASCGGDRTVFVWDVASGDSVRKFTGHAGKVNAVAFNEDASLLASASADMSVRLWDMKSQQRMPIQILAQAKDSVTSLAIKSHLIVAGCVDGKARTYDVRMGELREDFFDQPITSTTLSADSSLLLLSTLDSKVHLIDLESGGRLQVFEGHKNGDYRGKAAFGKGERTVVMGDEDGKVWIWDVESGKAKSSDQAHDRTILWTSSHPEKGDVVTASADGTVKVWPGLVK
ncbi:hypothetical protein RQP46_002914 [Phenoliferia psychrophenolica]